MAKDPKAPPDSDEDNPDGKQKGNPDPNVQALQQKLTEKDRLLKVALEQIEEIKKSKDKDTEATKSEVEKLTDTVKTLTDGIEKINSENRKKELAAKFPDILPDFLLGKTDEEAEIIAAKQREITKQNYDEKPSAHGPMFTSMADADKAIEAVKMNPSLKVEQKIQKIREIKLEREKI